MAKKQREGPRVLRLLLQPWWRLTRGLTLGVRGVVLDEGRVLLVRHSYVSGWHLPGGGVERGETLRAALARELHEEAGISLTAPARLHGIYSNHDIMPGDHVAVFIAGSWRRDSAWRPGIEILAAEFFALPNLPADATPGTRRRITEIFQETPPSEHW